MANPTIDAIVAEYSGILESWYDRATAAAVEAKNGTYSANRLTSDVAASWVDMISGWLIPVNTVLDSLKNLPQIMLTIAAAGGDTQALASCPDPGPGPLVATNLADIAGVQPSIPLAKVVPTYFAPQRVLLVQVLGTGALTANTTYQGSVQAAGRAIADVFLTVTP